MQDPEARVTELFRRHADDIHAYASWRVGRQDASDVVGEVFLVAWRSLDRIRAGEERAWLFGVARKVVLSRHRQSAASTAVEGRIAREPVGAGRLDDDVALRDQVHRALAALREADREVLITGIWFDLSPAEAAKVLDVSRPTYLVRLHRARKRFRAAYESTAPKPARNPLAV
ncbi:RNA polymerase sigma factor [Paractinoplanes lichenicola]|uniref:Sigma-70 family RNA polymerase sigma factor n=1 Tax=Paractinoplanes lichenicola TaxID=2802976 RepID=A0ABS1VGP8_9ACTN|nr:sigma-70 family RNA polymerase sigma factor [Actinoplanes lichenicola]MBL7253882.1 sigma-70 family RNA polymerase sigma factor [Actinoplanes lichenicola]